MFILLLVELLKVGGVIALTVGGHLVPHLSLLSCLETNTQTKKKKEKIHTQVKFEHVKSSKRRLISTDTRVAHSQPEHKKHLREETRVYAQVFVCVCAHANVDTEKTQSPAFVGAKSRRPSCHLIGRLVPADDRVDCFKLQSGSQRRSEGRHRGRSNGRQMEMRLSRLDCVRVRVCTWGTLQRGVHFCFLFPCKPEASPTTVTVLHQPVCDRRTVH